MSTTRQLEEIEYLASIDPRITGDVLEVILKLTHLARELTREVDNARQARSEDLRRWLRTNREKDSALKVLDRFRDEVIEIADRLDDWTDYDGVSPADALRCAVAVSTQVTP